MNKKSSVFNCGSLTIYFASALLLLAESCKKDDAVTPTINTANAKTISCDSSTFSGNMTLPDRVDGTGNVDYIFTCDLVVTNGATLTIAPGVVIQFVGANTGIVTEGSASISAVGTVDKPILFTGTSATKGSWQGVYIGSDGANNRLSHVTIQYAGGAKSSYADQSAGIAITRANATAHADINECIIDNNSGAGIWVGETEHLSSFSGNRILNNELSPVCIYGNNLSAVDGSNDYSTGNGHSYISINGCSSGQTITSGQTMVKLPVPYRVISRNIIIDQAVLTIQPGVVMEFEHNTGLRTYESQIAGAVHTDGAITAAGNAADHIIFRSADGTRGFWNGIGLLSASSQNQLTYCDISGGGLDGVYVPITIPLGNIIVYNRDVSAVTTIRNCSISSCSKYGIARRTGSSANNSAINADVLSANTFSDCTSGNMN